MINIWISLLEWRGTLIAIIIQLHHPLVTLLPGHQLRDHCIILLIDTRFVMVAIVALSIATIVNTSLTSRPNLWQLDTSIIISLSSHIIIGTNLGLCSSVWEHGVVHVNSGLWCMTLPFVFVVIHAIDVDYSDVVVSILHAVGASTSGQDSMTLAIGKTSLFARAL